MGLKACLCMWCVRPIVGAAAGRVWPCRLKKLASQQVEAATKDWRVFTMRPPPCSKP